MTPRQTVEKVYEHFGNGDIEAFLGLCSEHIEWVVNGPATLEKCRRFDGRAGVREFVGILGRTWAFNAFLPREFIVSGETVIVLGEEDGSDRETGEPFQNRWAHVFDVRDGEVIRFREFLCHWTGDDWPPAMSWQTHSE